MSTIDWAPRRPFHALRQTLLVCHLYAGNPHFTGGKGRCGRGLIWKKKKRPGLFKAQVAARIGRQPHEILLKRQGERPFKDALTLEDYGISNGVQLDL
jgi:hypothetical protein